jgi:hypothetical protein
LIFGSALASFCVEKFGTDRLVDLTEEDIQKRLNAFVALSQFNL